MEAGKLSEGELVTLTESLLMSGSTSASGAWNYQQFKALGIETPPPKGWKLSVIGKPFPRATIEQFLALSSKSRETAKTIDRLQLTAVLDKWLAGPVVAQVVAEVFGE